MGTLVRFAMPATVVMVLSGLFLVVDTFFIARLGTVELAGASLAYQTLARAEWGLLFGFTRVALIALPGVGLLSHFLFPLALHPSASGAAAPAQGLS